MPRSLRCVVLDNDETTGAYRILVAFLFGLQKIPKLTLEQLLGVIERLADCMIELNIFRPGLEILLKTLVKLRSQNKLDGVIMYTNQREIIPSHPTIPLLYSPPQAISYMMAYIIDNLVFDKIIARTTTQCYPKTFQKVLECFPTAPKSDIRHIVFVDDNATRDYILANDIPASHQHDSCWYRVNAYYRILSSDEFVECFEYCFKGLDISEEIQDTVMTYYYVNEEEMPNMEHDNELITLAEHLIRIF